MKYYLLTYSVDWADEFDLTDQRIFTEEELKSYIDGLDDNVEVRSNLGNVEAENEHTKSEYLDEVSQVEISKNEYDVLNKLNVLSGNSNALELDEY